MIDSYFRTPFQKILVNPAVGLLRGASPNLVTLAALLSGVAVLPLLAGGLRWEAFAALLISGYLDTLDGSIARAYGRKSNFGAIFDIASDRVVEFSVIFALFLESPLERGLVAMLMLGSVLLCVTTFLVAGIFAENQSEKGFHYSPGIMERGEAFCFFGAMILFPAWFQALGAAFSALAALTAVVRIWEAFKQDRLRIS